MKKSSKVSQGRSGKRGRTSSAASSADSILAHAVDLLTTPEHMQTCAITFRQARDSDWPAVQRLLTESSLPLAGAQQHIARFRVAVNLNGIMAVAGLEVYGSAALLRSVATAEQTRKQGLARQLIAQLLADARQAGVCTLYLLTTNADTYFTRHGFQPVERRQVSEAVQQSVEFQGVCPASAQVMALAVV